MKKKWGVWSQIITIFVIGLVVSYITGDFRFGALFNGGDVREIKSLLDTLSMVLAIISLILVTGYLVYRAARGKDKGLWQAGDRDEN